MSQPYRRLLEMVSCGTVVCDGGGRVIFCNRAILRILGYEEGELRGSNIFDILQLRSPVNREQGKDSLPGWVDSLESKKYLTKIFRKGGTAVDVQLEWDYVPDGDTPSRNVVLVISEISQTSGLEEKIRSIKRDYSLLLRMCKDITESLNVQEVLQIAVDSVTELVGLDTAAVYLHEADTLHLQATTPPLPIDFPDEMRSAPLEDHPHILKALDSRKPLYIFDYLKDELTAAERAVAEKRDLRTVLFVPLVLHDESIGVFIVGSNGSPSALSNAQVDLSQTWAGLSSLSLKNARLYEEVERNARENEHMLRERLQILEEKRELESQLRQKQKLEAIGVLAGGVAHDFNNMLGGIMGAAELLGHRLPNDETTRQLHQTILDATVRAADLTKQLLMFSRKSAKVSTNVDVHDIIHETVTLIDRTFDKRVSVNVELRAGKTGVVGDPSLLHNALVNLCINANQAMPDGGVLRLATKDRYIDTPYCTLSQFDLASGHYIEIEIQDNGCGIAEENLDSIFEPFFTTKEKGKGTGLGLSSVYGTIRQHGGAITVHSSPGGGTTFQLLLPLSERLDSVAASSAVIKKGSGCILVVDDEEIMRSTAEAILESLGYEVVTAENGQMALEIFTQEQSRIDLVLLDMIMPVMNGKVCFEKLQEIDPEIPVIVSSGFSTEEDIKEMSKKGLKGMIGKPYAVSSLSQILFDVLGDE